MRRWPALLAAAFFCVGALVPLSSARALDAPGVTQCNEHQPPFGYSANAPCVGDSVYLTFTACAGCVDLLSTTWSDQDRTLTLNTIYRPDACDSMQPCLSEPLIAFAGIADSVGPKSLILHVQSTVEFDSVTCVSEQSSLAFYTVNDCGGPPSIPPCENPEPLPIHLTIWPPCPQPADTVYLEATSPCEACLDLQEINAEPGLGWVVHSTSGPLEICRIVRCAEPDIVRVPLGQFAAGNHMILVTKDNVVSDSAGAVCLIREQTTVGFTVGADCPPPPEDTLQYVDQVEIGARACATCPLEACAGQPIPVNLGGTVNHSCYSFLRVELVWDPVFMRDRAPSGPPTVRVVFALNDCFESPCNPDSLPWHAGIQLPSMPAGGYVLRVESAIQVTCGGDSSLTVTGAENFAFTVLESCTQPLPDKCMWLTWERTGSNPCNATVAPGRPATLRLAMRATEPVAGFQGKLFLRPYGLEITDIRAIEFAGGMRVLWNRISDGAFFVLYSETGQLLPPCNPLPLCIDCCIPSPVLEVTVAVKEGARAAPITEMLVWEVIGADSLGGAIRTCVRNEADRRIMIARICADTPCDANGDDRTDIRDLVTMVNCLNHPGGCAADSAGSALDCDNDGDLDLADVICCAHVLLTGQMPDSAETVPAPNVYVRFGEPVRTAVGVDVPIAVHGGTGLSAARLGLSIPREHFDVGGFTVTTAPDAWLALHEVGDSEVSLGLVRLSMYAIIPEEPDVVNAVLHLTLRPGGSVTGEVWLDDGDFTGAQGQGLIPGESDRSVRLAAGQAGGGLTFAPPRPNPFTHETAFALTLEREADVELAVHDLSGRRVAVLHRGRLAAGTHAFTWAGGTGHGAAANGLYFVRALVDGRVLSQKVALLRGR